MRIYIIICIIMIFTISGCWLNDPFSGLAFETEEEILIYVLDNIKYVSDAEKHGIIDFWQQPWNTLADRSGDCEDSCLLFLWLCYENLGIKGNVIINTAPGGLHISVEYKGAEYLKAKDQVFFKRLDYDTAMFICDLFN